MLNSERVFMYVAGHIHINAGWDQYVNWTDMHSDLYLVQSRREKC